MRKIKKNFPPSTFSGSIGEGVTECMNLTRQKNGSFERLGYYGFIDLIYQLWKANRSCRKHNIRITIQFNLPMRWF